MNTPITCVLCGYSFTESAPTACEQCPLHGGCELVCCPNCGYSNLPDPTQTRSGRWLSHLLGKAGSPNQNCTLAECCTDCVVQVRELTQNLPASKLSSLLACGIQPGCLLKVIQQRPVTVVQIDEMEIALEDGIAAQILVDQDASSRR